MKNVTDRITLVSLEASEFDRVIVTHCGYLAVLRLARMTTSGGLALVQRRILYTLKRLQASYSRWLFANDDLVHTIHHIRMRVSPLHCLIRRYMCEGHNNKIMLFTTADEVENVETLRISVCLSFSMISAHSSPP